MIEGGDELVAFVGKQLVLSPWGTLSMSASFLHSPSLAYRIWRTKTNLSKQLNCHDFNACIYRTWFHFFFYQCWVDYLYPSCFMRQYLILLLEANAFCLESRRVRQGSLLFVTYTVLRGNYTKPLWRQTLAQAFQNDQNNISDVTQQDQSTG